MQSSDAVVEARRQAEICNACRYCEGFCAVFPAIERRRNFSDDDIGILANLCHGCKGCFHACQYAPPHDFGVNIPKILAEVRAESYEQYAWPKKLAPLLQRNGLVVAGMTTGTTTLLVVLTASIRGHSFFSAHRGPDSFYQVIPWAMITAIAFCSLAFSLVSLTVSARAFWKDVGPAKFPAGGMRAVANGLSDALTLKNLGGGGGGCNDIDEGYSQLRRWLHHAMTFGLGLCFASTITAFFIDHFLKVPAPYPFVSGPVILGVLGGLALAGGTSGLLVVKAITDPAPASRNLLGADIAVLVLLLLAGLSGLTLLVLRESPAMGLLLTLHLGLIFSFFALIPYSKLVHGLYRVIALIIDYTEQ